MKTIKVKKIAKSLLACGLILQGFIFAPAAYAEGTDDIVSVRTVDRDIMVGTTANSLYSSDEIISKMDLDASLANQSFNMSTTEIDATDLSNWYVYDHYDTKAYADEAAWQEATGYNKNLRPHFTYSEAASNVFFSTPLTVEEALERNQNTGGTGGNVYYLKEHIVASSENGNAAMKFYGYGTTGCTDFLFYPAQETGTKKVEYTINAKDVKTHSLSQAGFLFNCGITEDKLSGYALVFSFISGLAQEGDDPRNICAGGIQSAVIYKITNGPVALLHEDSSMFSPMSSYITQLKKIDLSSISFDGHFDVSNIEMLITNNSLKVYMTEAGEQSGDNPERKTLFDFQNQNSGEDTYCKDYTPSGFGGFGPIVPYQFHNCQYTSSYVYSNLKMSISESDSVLSGLSNCDYTKATQKDGQYVDNNKYFVLIGDNTEGENGFKDCFKRDFDDVYLEMLKNQSVMLITNLNIENMEGNINGTNYNLKDYLGENNVVQIQGNTAEELAAEIERVVANQQYSKEEAEQAKDALDEATGTGHDDHATARCFVSYNGLQVDKVNVTRMGEDSIELLIDDSLSINVTNPTHMLRYPDGTTKVLPDNKITIQGIANWPTGEYTVISEYAEKVSARTVFSVVSAQNSYLNGVGADEGAKDDHLSCLVNTIGVNRVAGKKEYKTALIADEGYQLPQNIVVKTDTLTKGTTTDANGVVRDSEGNPVELKTLVRNRDYTYDSATGEIVVDKDCITGNIYLYANTAKVIYDLTNVTAGTNPVTSVSSFDNKDLEVRLSVDSILEMPKSVTVSAGEESFEIAQDETKNVKGGVIAYLGNKVQVSSSLLGNNITIKASAGVFKVHYISNHECIAEGGETADIFYGKDYDNIITVAKGYTVVDASAALGSETDDEGNPLKRPESFTFEPETCAFHVDGEEILDDIYITVRAKRNNGKVTANVTNLEFDGESFCVPDTDYTAKLTAEKGYALPEQITVTADNQELSAESYEYSPETGEIRIDGNFVRGDIVIQAAAEKQIFTVTPEVKHLAFEGDLVCDMLNDYLAILKEEQGYALPETIRVTVDGADLDGFKYSNDTGELQISKSMLTGNVVITAEGVAKEFLVHTELGNLNYEGAATGNMEQAYKAKIRPYENYSLPAHISIKVGGEVLAKDAYSYDSITGDIEIFKGQIKDDVLIQANADKIIVPAKEYYVLYRLTNMSVSGSDKAADNKDYIATLRANEGYSLPAVFSVTSGDKLLRQGVDYGYNGITGVLTIPAESISGNIVVEAAGNPVTKVEQKKPDVSKLVVVPPKYENSFDGKVIGVNTEMEYSVDGGKSWTKCKGEQITGLGTGKVSIRFYATGTKNSSPIANIELDSATMEYYIPTISMSKLMGRNKKFQLKIRNVKGAAVKVSSSNPSIVKVNKKGLITSKKKTGKAKVVVTIIKGKHIVQYVAKVKVVKKVKKNYSLSKFKTSYKAPTIALYKKLTKGKKWKVKMTHTKNAKISFRSSNKSVATVSKSGVVKAKRSGNTRIMITVANGGVVDKYYVVLRVFQKGERSNLSYLKEIK